jgi:hypothetical protein
MISPKRIHDALDHASDKILSWLHPLAYPGRGDWLPPVLIVALPKSGSIYIQRALRRTLRVPVLHIAADGMSGTSFSSANLAKFGEGSVVSREHLQPSAFLLTMLAAYNVRRIVLHFRDPRSAITSWTRHMDSTLERRGLRAVSLACERMVPEEYTCWEFNQRLHWQIVNVMPKFVSWIENWLELSKSNPDVKFLITDYQEFARDNRAFIIKVLGFYEIPFQPNWLSLPAVRVGKNNIRTEPGTALSDSMPNELLDLADSLVPKALHEKFSWEPGPMRKLA